MKSVRHFTKEILLKIRPFKLLEAGYYELGKNAQNINRWNQTPLSEAVRFGHLHIASYLRQFIDSNPNQNWESSMLAYDVTVDDEVDEPEKGKKTLSCHFPELPLE